MSIWGDIYGAGTGIYDDLDLGGAGDLFGSASGLYSDLRNLYGSFFGDGESGTPKLSLQNVRQAWAQEYRRLIGAPSSGNVPGLDARQLAKKAVPTEAHVRAPVITPQQGALWYPKGYVKGMPFPPPVDQATGQPSPIVPPPSSGTASRQLADIPALGWVAIGVGAFALLRR